MAKKDKTEKRLLPWYRFKTDFLTMLEKADAEDVKEAVCKVTRYAYQYGENGEEIEASIKNPVAQMLFNALRQGADESIDNHKASVQGGKDRAAQRKAEAEEQRKVIDQLWEQNGGEEASPIMPDFLKEYYEKTGKTNNQGG